MSGTDLAGWLIQIVKAVVDAVSEAAKGPEPPTLEALKAKVHGAIDARTADWLAEAKAEANQALVEAAAAEFSDALKAELKPGR